MSEENAKMPHNGGMLERIVKQSGKTSGKLSRQMGYSESLLRHLYDTPSIRTHIWWEVGIATGQNIFAQFAERFPIKHKSKREKELETELEKVKVELEIYRRIVERR